MTLGLSVEDVLWKTPYSILLQLMHAEAVANGVKMEYDATGDTAPDTTELKNRDFKFEWH